MEQSELKVGDIVEMKKVHPCGGKNWKVLRVGVDFKFECMTCGHVIMVERPKALKMVKNLCWLSLTLKWFSYKIYGNINLFVEAFYAKD